MGERKQGQGVIGSVGGPARWTLAGLAWHRKQTRAIDGFCTGFEGWQGLSTDQV